MSEPQIGGDEPAHVDAQTRQRALKLEAAARHVTVTLGQRERRVGGDEVARFLDAPRLQKYLPRQDPSLGSGSALAQTELD